MAPLIPSDSETSLPVSKYDPASADNLKNII